MTTVFAATRLLNGADATDREERGIAPHLGLMFGTHRHHADSPRAAECRGGHLLVARLEDVEWAVDVWKENDVRERKERNLFRRDRSLHATKIATRSRLLDATSVQRKTRASHGTNLAVLTQRC